MEVSGSAVSVTRESRQLRGCESWHPFQPPPSLRCYRKVHELPREGMSDASHQIASVSSDRKAQEMVPMRGFHSRRTRKVAKDRGFNRRIPNGSSQRSDPITVSWTRPGGSGRDMIMVVGGCLGPSSPKLPPGPRGHARPFARRQEAWPDRWDPGRRLGPGRLSSE